MVTALQVVSFAVIGLDDVGFDGVAFRFLEKDQSPRIVCILLTVLHKHTQI